MPAQKFLAHDGSGGIQEVVSVQTGGAPSADKVPSLDANGRLDVTMMPSGVGADTSVVVASGALAAGDFVNLFNDGGTAKVRKADASSNVAPAHGFVLAAVTDGGAMPRSTGRAPIPPSPARPRVRCSLAPLPVPPRPLPPPPPARSSRNLALPSPQRRSTSSRIPRSCWPKPV